MCHIYVYIFRRTRGDAKRQLEKGYLTSPRKEGEKEQTGHLGGRAVQSSGTKGPAKGAHEGITGRTHSTVNVTHIITELSNKG